MEVDTLQIK